MCAHLPCSVKQIQRLADELDEVKVEVGSLGWQLQELEQAAHTTLEEAEQQGEAATSEPSTSPAPHPQQLIEELSDSTSSETETSSSSEATSTSNN